MAELTKKQKKLLEELTGGTYKAPSEQRREKRDANLRKQQAEADIAPVKTTEDKGFWNSVGHTAKSFGTGMLGGITGMFEAGTTDMASNFAKGFEEKSNGLSGQIKDISLATANILNPTKRLINAPMKMMEDMSEIRNDDSKNWLQKLGSATTTAVSNTLESLFPEKTLVNEFLQTVGFANKENLGEKTLETSEKVTKPYYDLSKEVYEEGQAYGGATETAGQVAQTVGRMIPSVVASAVTKNPQVGLGTMALSVKGSETVSAMNKGAELDEAIKIGNTKAMIEYGTEMLFGGINIFGKGALDDIVSKGVDAKVKKELANFLAKKGVSIGGEVLEEAIANTLGTIVDKGTVDPDASYSVDDFKDDTLITILSTIVLDGMTGGYGRRAYQSNIADMQGQTTVIEEDNIPTAEDIQAQIEEKTEELKASEDAREQQIIQEELEILQEDLVQQTPVENLKQQAFTYEANETDSDYKKAVYESANQVMNDTEDSHKLADVVAKISEERQTKYKFTNNEQLKELGYNVEGKTVNGLVNEDGEVLINVESAKFVNRVVGHETTHLLEGTKEYDELKAIAIEFAKTTGDYQSRIDSLNSIYEGREADIEAELTADIVGDYLFNNEQFVQELSVQKPTIFQKIKNLISDLVVKFKGTKQEKQLRELQRKFEKAYQATEARVSETSKNVISQDNQGRKLTSEQANYFKDSKVRDKDGNLLAVYHGTRGDFNVFDTEKTGQNYEGGYSSLGRGSYFTSDKKIAEKFGEDSVNEGDLNIKETYIDIKNPFYADDIARNDSKVLKEISEKYGIKEAEMFDGYNIIRILRSQGVDSTAVLQEYGYDGIIAEDEYVVFDSKQVKNTDNAKPTKSKDIRYSLTDNQGRKLSKEQQEFFKDSKIRDNDGNLMEMYHATDSDFTIFDKGKIGTGSGSSFGKGFYFATYEDLSSDYGEKLGKYYLNITNPYEYYSTDKEYIVDMLEKSGYNYDKEFVDSFEFEALEDLDFMEDFLYEALEGKNPYEALNKMVQNAGFDGIIAGSEVIAFEPEQIKNVDNKKPTTNPDIRYSLSEDTEGNKLKPNVEKWAKNSKARDENGNLKVLYHGTATGEFTVFDKSKASPEGDWGAGFYLTDNKGDVESNYEDGGADFDNKIERLAERIEQEEDISYEEAKEKAQEQLYKGAYKVTAYAKIENPAIVGKTYIFNQEDYLDNYSIEDFDSEEEYYEAVEQIVADDIDQIIWKVQNQYELWNSEELASVLWDAYNDGGIEIQNFKDRLNELEFIDDEGNLVNNDIARITLETLGFDGIIDPTVSTKWNMDMEEGTTHYIVFNSNQIKNVTNENPTDNPDINLSLSKEGEQNLAPTGDFDISSENIKLQVQEAIAPMQEIVTELVEQMKTIAPVQDVKTEINKNGVQMSVGEQVRTFNNSIYEVTDFITTDDGVVRARLRDNKGYETSIGINAIAENLSDPTKNNVSTLVENDSLPSSEGVETQNTEAFDNITDEDAPSFEDLNDVFDEVGETDVAPTVPSPLESRDIDEVGSKKVKAYQYEHPEFRPYFQAEAENMLYDLDNTVKGEKIAIKDEAGYITEWAGTTRQTAEAIAYLKDKFGYSYAEIRKGLNAIIEDHGAENIAVAKRIEFMLDERLREGYTTADGIEIPANEDYIKFLEEQGITAYNLENFNAITDEDAPIEEAPVVEEVTTPPETNENIPTIENVEEVVKDVAPVQNVPENPNMDVTEGKQRRWATTSTESETIRDEIQLSDLDVEKITYMPITNKETLSKANRQLESLGYDKALESFNSKLSSGMRVKAEDITLGERLMQEALKRGDKETAIDLIQNISILGTEIGQTTQALSIIQRMTPAGQLKTLEKTINRAKAKGNEAFENVELTAEMKKKILDSFNDDGVTYDQDKLNKTMDEVKQELAKQIKATTLDKVNAWRYLAMLGNPKTHIRNLVSNVAMFGTTEVKNAVARTIETVAPVKERTKTFKPSSEEVTNFANQTAMEMKEIISGDNKYNDETGIKALARTFETEVLEKAYNFNSDLLEKEDWWFSGARFKKAMSEFLTANGINTEEDIFLNPELVEKARTYALEQSRIATFRQYSYLANKIREVENKNTATNIAVGSIIPFKKTPINIAKTGLAYSPLGFAKTLTYDIAQVKKGNMEASRLIDNLSQNATGTALALAGYMLAMSGFLSGAGEDDEEAKYDYQLGKQSYAINIGNKSYSLSWLSPVAMPLFVGANAYSQLVEKEEWNGDVVVEALGQTLDPLNEMSFVSGLVDILSSYESGNQAIWGMVEAMGQNYATQFFPTLGSQIASVMDDTKRSTKVASDSDFKFVDETINKIMYKIPKLRELLEPSTDIWGNEVKQTENIFQRALENFIAPYSAKESTATEIDENIKEVFRLTGDNGVIPNVPKNTITFNNEKYKMSAEEYTTFKKTYGQTANDLLEDLFRTTSYKQAGSDEKAEMINEVYSYSSDIAKKQHLAKENVTYTNTTEDGEKVYKENTIKEAIKHDMTKEEYSLYSNDPEEYEFLEGKDSSYKRKYFDTQKSISDIEKTFNKRKDTIEAENMDEEEYDEAMEELSNEKKKSVVNKIINSGLEDTEKASLYKRYYNSDTVDTIVKSSINVDDYLTYTATEFKADYKSNGKVISGSRKKKVIEYVDSLDMDIPQKAILIKSTNTFKFNDYNNEIVEYVDTLNITLDEKKSILKDLDMTIDDDGYVYWD